MDIDETIAKLGTIPLPDLAGLDGALLAQRARSEARQSRMITSLAVAGSLLIGTISGFQSASHITASLVPFGVPTALTPLVQAVRG
jgi:hypothetical protein